MITTEERGRISLKSVIYTAIAAGFAAFGLMAAWIATHRGLRVRYLDGQYLVLVRYPGQWHELREFIQPDDPDVIAIYHKVGPDVWSCVDWVCRNISFSEDIVEWWRFPAETINRGSGDCEDSAFLACSLLRNFTNAHVVLGSAEGYGHTWCQVDGQILETTYTSAGPVPDPENYRPYILFNEEEVIELWPGGLRKVFELGRDEATKLNLIAQALGD